MSKIVIELSNKVKCFGKKRDLESVSPKVPRSQTFAFLGRNRAGRTTTIEMWLELLKADSGTLHVRGMDRRRDAMAIKRRKMGFRPKTSRCRAGCGWAGNLSFPLWRLSTPRATHDVLKTISIVSGSRWKLASVT